MAHHVRGGLASPPAVLRPPQRTEVRSASVHLHARVVADGAVPFPGGQTRPGSNPFHVGPDQRGNPQSFGSADAPGRHVAQVPAVGPPLANPNQTWEEMVGIGFAPQAHPLLPPPVRSWELTEPTCIQSPSLVRNDTSSAEPAHSRNAEDDDSLDEPSPQPATQRGRAREIPTGVSLAGVYGDDEQGKLGATRGLASCAGWRELWVL
ncbi:hypothetical protein HD554DRAFT_2168579 [Boletus coccyginus]|nr:hypothetical protein HD554DRAFT_2168579 [Boletus coccyginus]